MWAVGKVPIVEEIQIQFKKLFFGVSPCQFTRQTGLCDFAIESLIVTFLGPKEQITRQLHGNCTCPGDDLALLDILERGTGDANRVHTWIGEEGCVFSCNGCVDQVRGNAVQ